MKLIKCITKLEKKKHPIQSVKFDSAVLHLANIKCTLILCKRLADSTITTSDDCNGMCQQSFILSKIKSVLDLTRDQFYSKEK